MTHSSFYRRPIAGLFLAAVCFAFTTVAVGQKTSSAGPQPVPLPPPVAAPLDIPYPGTITLAVDITNVNDRILTVKESIPVKPGKVTLLYPEWLPGTHSPSNPISNMAGLVVMANGKRVDWVRDRVNMYAFHLTAPADAKTLDVSFQYLAPIKPQQGRISSKFADVTWNSVLLYPAGYFSRRIVFSPSIRLPEGWKFACSLEVKSQEGSVVQFKDTTLNTFIDSPLYAGVNFKRVDISSGADNQVFLDIFADKPADLEITPEELQFHRNLVTRGAEAVRLAPLRSLRFSVFAERHGQRQGTGASSVERRRHAGQLLYRLGGGVARPRPAAARVHAFVERQVSPSGRPVDAQLQRAHAERSAVGV